MSGDPFGWDDDVNYRTVLTSDGEVAPAEDAFDPTAVHTCRPDWSGRACWRSCWACRFDFDNAVADGRPEVLDADYLERI